MIDISIEGDSGDYPEAIRERSAILLFTRICERVQGDVMLRAGLALNFTSSTKRPGTSGLNLDVARGMEKPPKYTLINK
jgi:hypothetical protein